MADQKTTELVENTTIVDTDIFPMVDDPSGVPITKKVTWANIKATLKTYFDTLYSNLKLDSLLSVDETYSGLTCDGILGATLAFGDLVYLNTVDQRWELADADAEATAGDVQLAIVLAAGNDGDTRLLLLQGFVRVNTWNYTSYGQSLFVSTTAGDMTATGPNNVGDIVRVVGYVSTFANQIYFNPSGTWAEIL